MGKRVNGKTRLPARRYVNIRVGWKLAEEVSLLADDLGVAARALYVLGAALLVTRQMGTTKDRAEILTQIRESYRFFLQD
jgi:hypothetical protein